MLSLPTGSGAVEVIYVKIMVDEEERKTTDAWQHRLSSRLSAASDLINQYCDIRFALAEFGTWQSDNRISDLSRSLREFEQEVDLGSSQLAIGFSSQYRFRRGVNGLGGTRGPMHSYIMLRESSPNTFEAERLEALVHELGHYLGAAHSAHPQSVMRPIIGDGQARRRSFRIAFDPQNARIIQLVGQEISALGIRRYHQLSATTRRQLLGEYQRLAKELPQDPAAKRYIQFLQARR